MSPALVVRDPAIERETLRLDHNERLRPAPEMSDILRAVPVDRLNRYPETATLEGKLARTWAIDPERVLVTAGGDDGIDRVQRVCLAKRPEVVTVSPTFEMIPFFARLRGGRTVDIETLDHPAPIGRIASCIGPDTGLVAVVSPHNPTGLVASTERLLAIADSLPSGVVLLVDLAYVEFADHDPTAALLERENTFVLRTLSKAWGLAGLRVGYVLGGPSGIRRLREAGAPFPIAGPSLWVAERALDLGDRITEPYVSAVRRERVELIRFLAERGARPFPSQANFVLARVADARRMQSCLEDYGIRVRAYPARNELLRFSLPGDGASFARLVDGLADCLPREENET
ncbi:MAG: histidinol-phosphate aminotransferase family protein [Gemmatimonadetes bacterium]|nr:histidinol-phosphate aminotransferase family protein [Gemmatimonadota bacterium]